MAKRGLGRRGPRLVALLLLLFVLVAAAVVWRRSTGIAQARAIRELDRVRLQLEGDRARLARDLRDATSRARLGAIVERRLGMHVPHDHQVVILRRAPSEATR